MTQDTKKIIQSMTYLAAHQPNNTIDNRKAYKLLWLADRYHLRKYGRTITGDTYYAMPYGIVPSDTKCLLEGKKTKMSNPSGYKNKYIASVNSHQFKAISEPDLKIFSDSDQNALDLVLDVFGHLDALQLSELSHHFPEWLYFKDLLEDENAKNSYKIDLDLFFENATVDSKGVFDDNPDLLNLTKELYHQYSHV